MATCAVCGYGAASPFRFCPECGAPAGADSREQRKVVTVLFCDVVGSTALGESLDPEALRLLLARYFNRMKEIVERHGGVVEKFIGDAVMAVFGLPVVHEDDALRALRAAVEMRQAFGELEVEGRIGVNSGEVVAGTEERLATGDAVNVAARFQQAAEPGEILLGETTLRLAGEAVAAEAGEPLALKGKAAVTPVWRLVSVSSDVVERRFDSPLVGRQRELGVLADAWERVRAENTCELVTVVGSAGVGKSRLVAEFLARLDSAVVRGRCLSYGEEITYWPAVEVLKQLEARRSGLELHPAASDALAVLLGQEGSSSTDEIAWAFRKLLEAVARERPLVAVFDDIQWAADAFLDLLEHLAVLSTGAPILLLCLARPELLDRREGWDGVMRLGPLGAEDAEQLMDGRIGARDLDPGARERILQAAAGNPLFVEEMAAMLQESEDGEVSVPPTIQALLAARLDQLEAHERTVLEHGAIEGEIFHRGGVQALTPQESRLTSRLTSLVRRELVRPNKPLLIGDDAYRFRHLLIRDAAYEATPKARRAELHELFATWLEERGAALVELDEIVGYHLEQAYRYRQELGTSDDRVRGLAVRAGKRLTAAGSRALQRQDFRAAVALLERAAGALPAAQRDARFMVELSYARFSIGRAGEACSGLLEAAALAAASGDRVGELQLRLEETNYRTLLEPTPEGPHRLRKLAEEALPVFAAAGDHGACAIAYASLLMAEQMAGRSQAAIAAAAERVSEAARLTGDRLFLDWGETQLVAAHYDGATPVEECLRWLDRRSGVEKPMFRSYRALFVGMLGRFDEANQLAAEVSKWVGEFGVVRQGAFHALRLFQLAMLQGDAARAERVAREACEGLESIGERGNLLWACCHLAEALCDLDRHEEAEWWLRHGREAAPSVESLPSILWPQTQAKVLARRDDREGAEALAREAVTLARETDMLNVQARALTDLAEVPTVSDGERRAVLEESLALYGRKGNLVMSERVRVALTDQSIKLP